MNILASLAEQKSLPSDKHYLEESNYNQTPCEIHEPMLYLEILATLLAGLIASWGGWLWGGGHRAWGGLVIALSLWLFLSFFTGFLFSDPLFWRAGWNVLSGHDPYRCEPVYCQTSNYRQTFQHNGENVSQKSLDGLGGPVKVLRAWTGEREARSMGKGEYEPPERCSYGSVLREAWWGPLAWIVDGVLVLLDYGDLIAKIFPETEEFFKKAPLLSGLPWYWKVITLLIVNILLIWEGAFRAVRKRERQRDEYKKRLQEIEDAKPNIVLNEPDAESVELVPVITSQPPIFNAKFVRVRFVNRPLVNSPNAVAHGVRAFLKFYDPSHVLLLSMDGRWASSSQPSTKHPAETKNDLLPMDFAIEEAQSLDVAFWDPMAGTFVAWNNDNYNYLDVKKPEHILQGRRFVVEIRLVTVSVDKTFIFQLAFDERGPTMRRL
jgi:hypothetical protein